jgi:riboflavin synthase
MFTGLIHHVVGIVALSLHGREILVSIEKPEGESGWQTGESIAVNGVCLTLEKQDGRALHFFAQQETFERTTLRWLKHGQKVNLERAVRAGGRFGGHFVQGHVDEVARILRRTSKGQAHCFEIAASRSVLFFICEKGSVALDGISLTVSSMKSRAFTVDVIPHTYSSTNIRDNWTPGSRVNLEADMVCRQVFRAVEALRSKKR